MLCNSISVGFQFILSSYQEPGPIIIPSSIINNPIIIVGELLYGYKIYDLIGDNVQVSFKPDLPNGLSIDPRSGEIYGLISERIENSTYIIYFTNIGGNKELEINIGYIEYYYEANDKYPKTLATNIGTSVRIGCSGLDEGDFYVKCVLNKDYTVEWKVEIDTCKKNVRILVGIIVSVVCLLIIVVAIIVILVIRCKGKKNIQQKEER